jgi:hypothetical protein
MNCRKKKKKEKTFQKTRVRLSFFFALCSQREKQKLFFILSYFLSSSRTPAQTPSTATRARPNRLCAFSPETLPRAGRCKTMPDQPPPADHARRGTDAQRGTDARLLRVLSAAEHMRATEREPLTIICFGPRPGCKSTLASDIAAVQGLETAGERSSALRAAALPSARARRRQKKGPDGRA